MCLINQGLKYQGNIRWKFVEFSNNNRDRIGFKSPAYSDSHWNKNNISKNPGEFLIKNCQFGFHVYLFKQTAINAAKEWNRPDGENFKNVKNINNYFIFKLRCSNFIDGGIISNCDDYSDGKRGERWENAEVIEIFDIQGQDVTKTYEKYLL